MARLWDEQPPLFQSISYFNSFMPPRTLPQIPAALRQLPQMLNSLMSREKKWNRRNEADTCAMGQGARCLRKSALVLRSRPAVRDRTRSRLGRLPWTTVDGWMSFAPTSVSWLVQLYYADVHICIAATQLDSGCEGRRIGSLFTSATLSGKYISSNRSSLPLPSSDSLSS